MSNLEKKVTLEKNELANIAGILLNSISNYTKDVTNSILQYDLDLYAKITGEKITIEYARKNLIYQDGEIKI